jgi:hypothetical protein
MLKSLDILEHIKAICGANLRRGIFEYYVIPRKRDVFGESARDAGA